MKKELDARREQYLYMKEKFPQLSGKAQSQLLENCLYLGQKALREADNLVSREALKRIKVIFNETYDAQMIQESKKQTEHMFWKHFTAQFNVKLFVILNG